MANAQGSAETPRKHAFQGSGGLGRSHLGEFHLDPQFDFAEHAVEAYVARAVLEMDGRGLEPAERRRRQVAAEEADLEFIEGIERKPAALDGVAPPLGRILDSSAVQ